MFPVNLPKPVDLLQQVLGTERIQESEWASSEWGESKSKDGSNVTIEWTAQYPILKAPYCFVDKTGSNAKLDFLNIMTVCVCVCVCGGGR